MSFFGGFPFGGGFGGQGAHHEDSGNIFNY